MINKFFKVLGSDHSRVDVTFLADAHSGLLTIPRPSSIFTRPLRSSSETPSTDPGRARSRVEPTPIAEESEWGTSSANLKLVSRKTRRQVHQSPDNHTMLNHTTLLFTQNQPEQNGLLSLLCIKFALTITQLAIPPLYAQFSEEKNGN